MRGKMSLQEYKKNFNNLGTIGQQKIQESKNRNSDIDNKIQIIDLNAKFNGASKNSSPKFG